MLELVGNEDGLYVLEYNDSQALKLALERFQ